MLSSGLEHFLAKAMSLNVDVSAIEEGLDVLCRITLLDKFHSLFASVLLSGWLLSR